MYYHRAHHVNTGARGDSGGSNRDAIEEAAGQVMRALNGLVEALPTQQLLGRDKALVLLPVIFTTARLYVSETDLASADLVTGNVNGGSLSPVEVPYLFYQYALSPGLKHGVVPRMNVRAQPTLTWALAYGYVRTIAVVSAAGVEQIFRRLDPGAFRPFEMEQVM